MVLGRPGGRYKLPEAPVLGPRPAPRPGATGPPHNGPVPPPAGCSRPALPANAPIAFPATGARPLARRVQPRYRQLAHPRYPGLADAPPRTDNALSTAALRTPPIGKNKPPRTDCPATAPAPRPAACVPGTNPIQQ